MEDEKDRRGARRVQLEAEVTLTSPSQFYAGLTFDVSEGGLFVATYQPLAIGEEVEVELTLPTTTVKAKGVVRWTRAPSDDSDAPPGAGLSFTELPDEGRTAIEELCRERPPLYHDIDD